MKFLIGRASDCGRKQPCNEAVLVDKENLRWEIEINSMEELLSIIEKEDDIIIYKSTANGYKYRITIYDDYVE